MRRLAIVLVLAGCGSSSGTPNGDGGGIDARSAIDAGPYLAPAPLVSRGKPVFAQSSVQFTDPTAVVDGIYREGSWAAGSPSVAMPAWIAIDLGTGPTRVLLSWNAGGSYNYDESDYGSPGDYSIDVSPDSTDGADGTWSTVATVTGNDVRTRGHAFDFTGMRWVRMVITTAPAVSPNGVQLDEIDVHDISAGADDTWFFMGDSITGFAYDRDTPSDQPSYAEDIKAGHPGYFPAMIDGGHGGDLSADGVAHLDAWLATNADYHFVAIQYGTNDAAGNSSDTTAFASNMQTIIDGVVAAGRVPVLAHIPYASDGNHDNVPLFNAVIDQLTASNHLMTGPDLYTYFLNNQGQLMDQIHPDPAGRIAMNQLWAQAMDGLYAP